ncbi:MAG: rhodanese-like domain-containing protein [Pseudomonadota bacterium]|nr:rhodanese-like domain-containing protein [Pseudomonadota bacterium]
MSIRTTALVLTALLLLPGMSAAETAKGRIKYVSNKANTIQIDIKGKDPVVVRFDDKTTFENAGGIKEIGPPDLVRVEYEPGKPATLITKIVFGLPPGAEIDIKEMTAILRGKRGEYLLGDARPANKFPASHIPSAVSTFPKDKKAFLEALPVDKDELLVFYCGGPTCPFTGQAVEAAMEAGYTNVKGFQAGLPGWKKSKLAVHSSPGWMAKNLDVYHVLIDARDTSRSARLHIESAVALPATQLQAMTQQFIQQKKVALLPGVTDKGAPIVVYANSHADKDAIVAYKQLRDWGYTNASILYGGLDAWKQKGYPTASGQMATRVDYTKKLAKGAIDPKEFAALEKSRVNVVFVDVRRDDEIAKLGMLRDAVHMPLDEIESGLASLPKDKEIVTYCENGIRAEMAYETLRENGYQVRFLNEAIMFDDKGNYSL